MKILQWIENVFIWAAKSIRLIQAGYRYEMMRRDVPLDFIKVLRLSPGDVLVVKTNQKLKSEDVVVVESQMREILKGRNNVFVLDGDWNMEVVRCEQSVALPEEK